VDFTGSSEFGQWLEQNARQALVYTEKSGVNSIVIDSTDDFEAMARNIGFSLSLYSGQMCTAPQNLLVPRDGISVGGERWTLEQVEEGLGGAVDQLLGDPARAVEVTGSIVNDGVLDRLERAPGLGRVVLGSRVIEHPQFPEATVRTPTLIAVDAADRQAYGREQFGPISFVGALVQPDRQHLGQPVGRVLRLPRDRRQPGRQCVPDRRGIRRRSLPDHRVAAPDGSPDQK